MFFTLAGRTHYFQAIVVAQIDQALQVRQQEPAKHGLAQQRSALAAQVVADEVDVDHLGRRIEGPLAHFGVVVDQMLEHCVDQFGLVVHLQVHILHAQQIDQVVPEGRPVAAEDGVFTAV